MHTGIVIIYLEAAEYGTENMKAVPLREARLLVADAGLLHWCSRSYELLDLPSFHSNANA